MPLLFRHFGSASGRIGVAEYGPLGVLPLVVLVIVSSAWLGDAPSTVWIAWALALTVTFPLWVLVTKRLADLGMRRFWAHGVGLVAILHLGLAGIALADGQPSARWLFIVPAPGAMPANGAAQLLWALAGLMLAGSVVTLAVIPGQARDNAFGPDPRVRLAMAAGAQDGALEAIAGRLLAAPSRAFANTGRLTLLLVPILMVAAGVLRYDAGAGELTTAFQGSSVGGITFVEAMLRGGLVSILFAPPIILVAMIALPLIAGLCLQAVVRWRTYGRAEALALIDAARGPGPDSRDRPAG